jgi:hypothetical protein
MYYWLKETNVDYKGASLVVADNQIHAKQIFKLQMIDSINNDIVIRAADICPYCKTPKSLTNKCNCKTQIK